MNGFELLARLVTQPFVIFTTAYDQHALRAFETNAIDYLLKPIEPEQLERALKKLGRLRPIVKPDWQQNPALPQMLQELTASLREGHATYPNRIASRVGERISFLPLDDVTHFVAQDKLTFAVSNGRRHCVDQTIADLEHRLDPAKIPARPPFRPGECRLDSRSQFMVRRQSRAHPQRRAAHPAHRRPRPRPHPERPPRNLVIRATETTYRWLTACRESLVLNGHDFSRAVRRQELMGL